MQPGMQSEFASHQFAFHHVGIVTRGLNACIELYQALGYTPSEVFRDPNQGADIVLLTRPRTTAGGRVGEADTMIELVSPYTDESPAMSWAQRIDAGPYHTCYEVPDLEDATERLRRFKVHPVMDPVPAVAFGGRRVTFLWGRRSGLLELLEAQRETS
jgi:methylmalonyl-CoA/ethylmalonyl-CoA epimerase